MRSSITFNNTTGIFSVTKSLKTASVETQTDPRSYETWLFTKGKDELVIKGTKKSENTSRKTTKIRFLSQNKQWTPNGWGLKMPKTKPYKHY